MITVEAISNLGSVTVQEFPEQSVLDVFRNRILMALSGDYCTVLTELNGQPTKCPDPVECARKGCQA